MATNSPVLDWLTSPENTTEINQLVSRLAFFVSTLDTQSGTDLKAELHQHLVLQVLSESPEEYLSLDELRLGLETLFQLSFDEVEIVDAAQGLKRQGKVEEVSERLSPNTEETTRKYKIHSELKKRIETTVYEKRELKTGVVESWLSDVAADIQRPLSSNERAVLVEDLEIYLGYLYIERQAQTLASYGTEKNVVDYIEQLDQKPRWKRREKDLHELRTKALQMFFDNEKIDRRRAQYILELSDSAFLLSLLHVDTNLAGLAKSAFKDRRVFLDSNIIYRLLGLQTESLAGMTRRVIDASREMGCKLLVSTASINELRTSLERSIDYLRRNPPQNREYEALKLQYSGEARGFVIAYWKEYARNGAPLELFANKYRYIDRILTEEFGIEITSEHVKEVQAQSNNLIYETNAFLEMLGHTVADHPGRGDYFFVPRPRNPELARHDVTLLLIVERIRGKACQTFSEANAWLLTADGHLINYSHRRSLENASCLPLAIHGRDWLLFLRPWLPRTKDYDRAAVALISSDRFRSFNSMNPYLIDQVTRILASYQGMTPGLAAEMLAYHGFTQQLLAIERKVQQEISEIREDEITGDPQTYIEKMAHRISMEEIAKVVESTALLIAEKKEQERARAAYELTAVQKELKQVTSSLHLLQEKQEALKSDLEAKTNTIADLEETSATTADDMRALSAQTASAHTQIERLSKSFLVAKWLLGMCIGLIGIGIVEPLLNGVIVQNNLALSSPIRFFVYLSSMSLGLVVGLGLRRFWKVFSVLETILSLITILWAITMLSGR